MAETKTKVRLASQGWKIGDKAFSGSVTFGDEDEASRESYSVGLFRTRDAAKAVVEAEVAKRSREETREGWWGGDVEEGAITDESFDDHEYGWVEDWSFEYDDRATTSWMHAGHDWNED